MWNNMKFFPVNCEQISFRRISTHSTPLQSHGWPLNIHIGGKNSPHTIAPKPLQSEISLPTYRHCSQFLPLLWQIERLVVITFLLVNSIPCLFNSTFKQILRKRWQKPEFNGIAFSLIKKGKKTRTWSLFGNCVVYTSLSLQWGHLQNASLRKWQRTRDWGQ